MNNKVHRGGAEARKKAKQPQMGADERRSERNLWFRNFAAQHNLRRSAIDNLIHPPRFRASAVRFCW
jgi:hypothetical protein